MKHQNIAILGSTGSIGTQALDIISDKPELFTVSLLTANSNYRLLAEQANRFQPDMIVLCDESVSKQFQSLLTYKPSQLHFGQEALIHAAIESTYDLLLNSLVGFAGFMSTYHAIRLNKKVALANKESLVVGGELLSKLPGFLNGNLIPVDSEHSAMLQSLIGEEKESIKKIIITASGGPFRTCTKEELEKVTVEDALNHPNWSMGNKITIDSATMMNKGLEIIEAKWLFDLPAEAIEPVIHPQSIIHSIVEFVDGSSKAQLGPPDMKVPILYSLTYPSREPYPNQTLDYTSSFRMDFEPVNRDLFPCLDLAVSALKEGGAKPAILNAANEIAVERFLNGEIRYIDIHQIIEKSLEEISADNELSPDSLQYIDKETRVFSNSLLK
ncbi:1-deoxy-D-xylulose-5-phosphate reductoisomerase [Rhodohalobacter mucosus]|uniref:1-deoxy-D-xylulose 5-phosphate reductoisomerase n=1 Tax=Rhodohalobacter mucosus TaxID=2079485 RepID=A0A316U2N8_9BACT|nr:1-deoxy-D-xylulose-5-phosphate reductoisomerase [Rhodohalobacter mucosus]PWN07566.1 1-deoxy-D-xylulose-5-phosphate reductoisomerase [Rhodohalobacter mucosus]